MSICNFFKKQEQKLRLIVNCRVCDEQSCQQIGKVFKNLVILLIFDEIQSISACSQLYKFMMNPFLNPFPIVAL